MHNARPDAQLRLRKLGKQTMRVRQYLHQRSDRLSLWCPVWWHTSHLHSMLATSDRSGLHTTPCIRLDTKNIQNVYLQRAEKRHSCANLPFCSTHPAGTLTAYCRPRLCFPYIQTKSFSAHLIPLAYKHWSIQCKGHAVGGFTLKTCEGWHQQMLAATHDAPSRALQQQLTTDSSPT